jgi:hypothetical protein
MGTPFASWSLLPGAGKNKIFALVGNEKPRKPLKHRGTEDTEEKREF